MRVVAGWLGGRIFESPGGHRTHPMSDKIRGALFNALGDLQGLTVLDAYAGSGALSIEAVSRGAENVVAVDVDKSAYLTILANVEKLNLGDNVSVIRKNIGAWSKDNQQMQFDVVLADPPYDDVRPDVLERLVAHVKPGGVYVISWPGREPVREFDDLKLVSQKNYGDARLVFYQRIQ